MRRLIKKFFWSLVLCMQIVFSFAQQRIYIANDDHTDYYWRADGPTYHAAFIEMIDFYIEAADSTMQNKPEFQSRFNCDGSYWMWIYEQNKTPEEFYELIKKIRSGHISIPLNPLISLTGGVPVEALLRGMYYAGRIERRYGLRFQLAYAIENQTMPLGLVSLFRGSGAKFTWHGVCACHTRIPDIREPRPHDIYWWKGLDGEKMLKKWYSFEKHPRSLGGYAEARDPREAVAIMQNRLNTPQYPYSVGGVFGKGWDDLKTLTYEFVEVAKELTTEDLQVIVSNEKDFFEDIQSCYGDEIPVFNASFGNDWDLHMASAQELVSRVKRAVEKLRTAEALAAVVSLHQPGFMDSFITARDQAYMDLGVFYEHNWISNSEWVAKDVRLNWSESLAENIENYVNQLYQEAKIALSSMIAKTNDNQFFVFNPLGWERNDYADIPYQGGLPVHVIDLITGQEVPSQVIRLDRQQHIRILAESIPSLGYKIYQVKQGSGKEFDKMVFSTPDHRTLENSFYTIHIDSMGLISGLLDKTNNYRELISGPYSSLANRLVRKSPHGQLITPDEHITPDISIEVENSGSVSTTILIRSTIPLQHTSRITLFRDIDRIEIRNEIEENFGDVLTWEFPFDIDDPVVWHEELGAIIKARLLSQGGHYAESHSRYEWLSANHFIDIGNEEAGITLSNSDLSFFQLGESTISYLDSITPVIKMLSGYKHPNPDFGYPNQGGYDHFLQRFALQPHNGYDQTRAMKFALEHQNPLVAYNVSHGLELLSEPSYSLLNIDNPDIILWALKPSDSGIENTITARVWNMKDTAVSFHFTGSLIPEKEMTHIETPLGEPVNMINRYQMKTFLLSTVPSHENK